MGDPDRQAAPPGVETTSRMRLSRAAMIGVGIFTACTIPLVAVSPWLLVLLTLPILAAVYVVRSGVDIDSDGVTVRAAFGTTTTSWTDIAGVEIRGRGELWLVRRAGGALRLPSLRVRDLPRLHEASQGRLGLPPASAADRGTEDGPGTGVATDAGPS